MEQCTLYIITMADETIHRQEFNVRDLATRSVTLYPFRAEIIRDINGVTLKVSKRRYDLESLSRIPTSK